MLPDFKLRFEQSVKQGKGLQGERQYISKGKEKEE